MHSFAEQTAEWSSHDAPLTLKQGNYAFEWRAQPKYQNEKTALGKWFDFVHDDHHRYYAFDKAVRGGSSRDIGMVEFVRDPQTGTVTHQLLMFQSAQDKAGNHHDFWGYATAAQLNKMTLAHNMQQINHMITTIKQAMSSINPQLEALEKKEK